MSARYERRDLVAPDEPGFGAYAPNMPQAALLALARVPPLYRGVLRRRIANLVRALGRTPIIDLTKKGDSFRLRQNTNLIEDGILVHPAYNSVEIDFLREGTPAGGVFVDLGANIGLYTLPLARKVGSSGRVLAIDANPDIVKALHFNIAASKLDNVAVACVAVGDSAGKARLEIRKADLAIVEVAEDPEGEIEIKPLAEIVREAGIDHIDTMKADIEGFEDRAIRPLLDGHPAMHPSRIVIEHLGRDHWRADLLSAFAHHGYRLVGKTRGNSLYEKATRS